MPFNISSVFKPISNFSSQVIGSGKSSRFKALCGAVALVAAGVGLGIFYHWRKPALTASLPPARVALAPLANAEVPPAPLPRVIGTPANLGPAAVAAPPLEPVRDPFDICSSHLLRLKAEQKNERVNEWIEGVVNMYSNDPELDHNQVLIKLSHLLKNQCQPHGPYPEHFANDIIRKFSQVALENQWTLDLFPANPQLCNDPDRMLANLDIYGGALEYASEGLRGDANFMLHALQKDPLALMFASQELKQNRSFLLPAINANPLVFPYVPHAYKRDPEAVCLAVAQRGSLLQHASTEIRANRDMVIIAISQDPNALQFACPDLQNDPEVLRHLAGE